MNGVSKLKDDTKAETDLRSSEMMCLGGEEEFDRIMNGDFSAFNRSDCALRFNEVFHWAWESWRAAVGTKIGTIYAKAIDVMNIGAKANGIRTQKSYNTNNFINEIIINLILKRLQ